MWVEIASFCNRFNCLPRQGGMMDQFPREMQILGRVLSVLDEYEKELNDKEAAKH